MRRPRLSAATPGLPRHRARDRLTAYVYGNILVLGAVAVVSPHDIEDGAAIAYVAATTVATYLAHVIAHLVGSGLDQDPDVGRNVEHRRHLRDSVIDAWPIATSGSVPVLVLVAGALGWAGPAAAQFVAGAVVVIRLALIGVVLDRYQGRRPVGASMWAGLVLAALSGVTVALKVAVAH